MNDVRRHSFKKMILKMATSPVKRTPPLPPHEDLLGLTRLIALVA